MKYVFFINEIDDITEDVIKTYVRRKGQIVLACDNDKDRMSLIRDLNLTIARAMVTDVGRRKRDFVINLCTMFINDLIKDFFTLVDIEYNI